MTAHRPTQWRVIVALLLLVCILAGGVLAVQRAWPDLIVVRLAGGEDIDGAAQLQSSPVTAVGQNNAPPPPESRFEVIALRPLFTAGRRPADQPESPVAAKNVGVPTGLMVTGVVLAGADSVAIIEPERPGAQAKPALVVGVGDDVAGWTVETIEAGRIILVREGERHELPLVEDDDPRRAGKRPRSPAQNPVRPATGQVRVAPQPGQVPIPQTPVQQPGQARPLIVPPAQ
ncbi:MAG: hypothetical protein OEZ03_05700 [Alphaproteobacteria bacterium]|nr:hypothetical protein [Alphaproteobacteria bacterium]